MDASRKLLSLFLACLCVAALSFMCSDRSGHAEEGSAGTIVAETGDIGIVVERAGLENGERIYRCKYCGKFIDVGIIHSEAENRVKDMLDEALIDRGVGHAGGKGKGLLYIEVLIYRYRERQGGNFAAEEPAGVGFHAHLMEGDGLKKVFVFDKDQEPLSENPLGVGRLIERHGRWVTVDELAGEGINAAVDDFIDELP